MARSAAPETQTPLDAAAFRVLERNTRRARRDGREFRFTAPSPDHYPFQWLWDSCFHAIVWARRDWIRAAAELEGLFAHQDESGRIPHVVFWDGDRVSRLHWHFLESRNDGGRPPLTWKPRATAQVQPPVLAVAVERIAAAGGGTAYVERVLPALARFYRYLARERDPDGDGLVSVISQFETGLDFSPAWRAPSPSRAGPVRIALRHRVPQVVNKALRYDVARIFRLADHHQESVLFNVVYGRALRALARLARSVGDDRLADWADGGADRVTAALVARCYDPRRGVFCDLAGRAERRDEVQTVASLTPLALPDLPAEAAARLVETLTDERRFWPAFPVPSVALDEPTFSRDNRVAGIRFIWRGATSMNTNWLIVHGLREHGYDAVADELAARSRRLVERHGFNEFYDPLDGRPVGEPRFSWATLVTDVGV